MILNDCKKVLIFVPHQDDEIAVAGALIWKMRQKEKEVFVCYATNGDYEIDADIRYSEACNALEVLGVDENHIIMLGYPDTSNEEEKKHIFYYDADAPICSKAGHTETYGGKLFTDYAWKMYGEHHAYTKKNYKQDVKQVILNLMPDFLICVDMDHHVDHRMLSLVFEQALGEVLRENSMYCPKVWKSFAYGTNFSGERDYWNVNLNETQFPHTRLADNKGRMDNPFYDWKKRVRFPVDENLYAFPIEEGLLYQALEKHVSQKAILFAETKINCDEVYWERRTDNLLLHADIRVSSGKAEFLNDFMLFNCSEIHQVEQLVMSGMWKPEQGDKEKKVSIYLEQEETLQSLSIWGKGRNVRITVSMDGNRKQLYLKHWIGEVEIFFSTPVKTKRLEICFTYKDKEEFGVGEIEAFEPKNNVLEYAAILCDSKALTKYYTQKHFCNIEVYQYYEFNIKGKQDTIIYEELKNNANPSILKRKKYKVYNSPKNKMIHLEDGSFIKIIRLNRQEWNQRLTLLNEMKKEFQRIK